MNESEKNLRLLREYVVISLQEYDDSGQPKGPPTIKRVDKEEESDEINWYVDKYGRPDWESTRKYLKTGPVATKTGYHTSRDPFGKLDPDSRTAAINSIEGLLDNLISLNQSLGGINFNKKQLIDIILPWGDMGFDALRRIYIVMKRTGKIFPFFSYRSSLTPVTSVKLLPFPSEPAPQLISWLMEQKKRIGKSDTGKGEFLISILSGATPTQEHPGDIKTLSGNRWEIKDLRGKSRVARLGDVDSQLIYDELRTFDPNGAHKGIDRDDFAQIVLQNVLGNEVASWSEAGESDDKDDESWEEAGESSDEPADKKPKSPPTQKTETAHKLDGFIVITDKGFNLVPIPNIKFAFFNKRRRAHVRFEGI